MANGWGGAREGGGRPRLEVPRKQRQIRATDEEWEIIKSLSAFVKKDIDKARELLKKSTV